MRTEVRCSFIVHGSIEGVPIQLFLSTELAGIGMSHWGTQVGDNVDLTDAVLSAGSLKQCFS